jgi:hypothetical protein
MQILDEKPQAVHAYNCPHELSSDGSGRWHCHRCGRAGTWADGRIVWDADTPVRVLVVARARRVAGLSDAEIQQLVANARPELIDRLLNAINAVGEIPTGWQVVPLPLAGGLWDCLAHGPEHVIFTLAALCHSAEQACRSAVDEIRRRMGDVGTAAAELAGISGEQDAERWDGLS